jgi:hypothetical protein
MHHFFFALPGLALMLGSLAAHASTGEQACNTRTLAAVARWADVQGRLVSWEQSGGLIAAAACKSMPDAPDTTIAAVAFDIHHEGPSHSDGSKLQVIALVEGERVLAAHRSTIEEDTLTAVGSYRIDTARYHLAPGMRAFGTVFRSAARGPSCPDASADAELTLWLREGSTLRPVLGSNLHGWVSVQGESCSITMGDARSEEADISIAVEKTTSHGLADLVLTARITQIERKNGDFNDTGKRTARTVLRYDGRSYGSDMFRTFWYPAALRKEWGIP